MDDRLARLESTVADLAATVRGLEARLETLEGAAPTREERRPQAPTVTEGNDNDALLGTREVQPVAGVISLLGRTCLALGGAFLLRALTDAGTVPQAMGVALGLLYAVVWLAAAFLAGRGGRRLSAEFHGVTSVIIAYPLLVEASTSFQVLGPRLAAAILAGLVALGLTVCWRRQLLVTTWGITLAAVAVGLVLSRLTFRPQPFSVTLLLLGIATLLLTYLRGWHGPRWAAAFGVDLMVVHLVAQAARPGGPKAPWDQISVPAVQVLALALFGLYLATISIRCLTRHRNVTLFEAVQTAAVLVIGFGGAARIAAATDTGVVLLGVAATVLGGASYAVSFASVDRHLGRGRNFVFFTSLALILILSGTWVAAPKVVLVPLWSVLALAAAVLGGRHDRVTLRAHAAAYTLAVATLAGLVRAIANAVSGSEWHPISALGVVALVASALGYGILVITQSGRETTWPARLPRLVVAVTTVAGLGSLVVTGVVKVAGADPGILAATRSVVLALAALILAGLGRQRTLRELGWLVYPILVAGGLKLVLVDLRAGRPATLFIAFVAYGIALIVAPRLVKRREEPAAVADDA